MKRVLLSLLLTALPLSAEASTELARQWGLEANRLSAETIDLILAVDMGQPSEVSDRFALDVYRFGRTSADLARWIDDSAGPNDLGCIFRGMAAESEDQILVLEEASDQTRTRESLRRLASMFADAEIIALVAQRDPGSPIRLPAQSQDACRADARAALKALR